MKAVRITPFAVIGCAVALAATGCNRAASPTPVMSVEEAKQKEQTTGGGWTPMVNTDLSYPEAISIAQERYTDLAAIETDLKPWGRDEFVVSMLGEDRIRHVVIDGVTREITDEEIEYLDDADRKRDLAALKEKIESSEYTLADWAEVATKNYNSNIIREVELELDDDNHLVLEVELRAERDIVRWIVDPETGEIEGREGRGTSAPIRPTGPFD